MIRRLEYWLLITVRSYPSHTDPFPKNIHILRSATFLIQGRGWPRKVRLESLNGMTYFLISPYFWMIRRALDGNNTFAW